MRDQAGWHFVWGRYLEYFVRVFEEHTDGSPLAKRLLDAWETHHIVSWRAASLEALHMHTALSNAQCGCCKPYDEDGDPEAVLCRKCLSLDIAWSTLHCVEDMTGVVFGCSHRFWTVMEDIANVLEDIGRYAGAKDGFAPAGRHKDDPKIEPIPENE